jgi:glycosyltransferase involved in cell wall biosynthesis
MNVLMVVHQFLPKHLAGTELYTYHLARALLARGHHVTLFFTEIRNDRPQYELSRGELDGIPFYEAVHNRSFRSFRHLYCDPEMERLFERVLDETSADLVHIQHLYLHSLRYIDIARDRGLPVLYTLHEYMLMCLNSGLLLRPGLVLCHGPETRACADCAASVHPTLRPRRYGLVRETSVLLNALRRMFGRPQSIANAAAYIDAVRRWRSETEAALEKVDLFVAPSRFIRQRFIDERLVAPERIVYSDHGFFVEPFRHLPRIQSSAVRVGYVGTISEYKGVHLIVDAFRKITEPGIECRIYGDLAVFPEYGRRLLAAGIPPTVRYMGRLKNTDVATALADLDLLVVPSMWFENSPLTIHEAFLAGLPVVTSDRGGMAELVEHGKSGLHFRLGDADDLRRQLLRVLHEPGLLDSMRKQLPVVKTIEQDAAGMEQRYGLLLEGRLPVS